MSTEPLPEDISQRIQYLLEVLNKSRQIIDAFLVEMDIRQYILQPPPIDTYIAALSELAKIVPLTSEINLSVYISYAKKTSEELQQIEILAGTYKKIRLLTENARVAEERGNTNAMSYIKEARNLAHSLKDILKAENGKLLNFCINIQSECQDLYEDFAKRHEYPTTAQDIGSLVNLILDWKRMVALNKGRTKVIYFNDTSYAEISILTVEDALEIAQTILMKKWEEKIHQYVAVALELLDDPERNPKLALELLKSIDQLPGLNDDRIGLDLPPYVKAFIENAKNKIEVEVIKRANLVQIIQGQNHRKLKIFLSYAAEDKKNVRHLYNLLVGEGVDAWLDDKKLLPGNDWRLEISKALRESDAIIICLSQKSTTKEGYFQREISECLDIVLEKPDDTIFIIPIRLEDCVVPNRITRWHWIDLFSQNGYQKLLASLQRRAEQVGANKIKYY